MSYILDALKKAERERGTTRVPTLMTVHDLRAMPKNRLWIIASALVIFVASGLLYLTHTKSSSIPQEARSLNDGKKGIQANAQEATGLGDALSAEVELSARQAREFPLSPKTSISDKSLVIAPSGPKQLSGPRVNPQLGPTIVSSDAPQSARPVPSAQAMPSPDHSAQESVDGPPAGKGLEQATPDTSGIGAKQTTQVSLTKQAKPAPLSEAAARMNMSVLVYDENKAERMVFIDGRKYIEGDYVEGQYLVESITLDGAVLSYEAERILLRPRTR
jgi:hypothetical protein